MRTTLLSLLLAAAAVLTVQEEPPAEKGPVVGAPAPTLRLNDHLGSATDVGGERETWTVLAFYPKAMTPG